MSIRNISLGRTKLLMATTLTLLMSVAQSDQTRGPGHDLESNYLPDQGFDLGYSREFIDIDESGLHGYSNASVAVSSADEFGEISLIEMNNGDKNRMHFNFRSYVTNELLSATLVTSADSHSLTFDLPSGQIVLENDTLSVITPTGFSQVALSGDRITDLGDGQFPVMLNDVFRGSDMLGFNLSMAETFAESNVSSLALWDTPPGKGSDQNTEGGWACGGALLALAAANAALAAAIAATYATVGLAAAAIAGAVSVVGAAIAMVDMYCMQM